jgi:hypothetical protein
MSKYFEIKIHRKYNNNNKNKSKQNNINKYKAAN